jgi:hypothetical protein
LFLACPNAQAVSLRLHKTNTPVTKEVKAEEKTLADIINKQVEYVNKHDLDSIDKLYSKDFINNDGFGKEVYFQLIKDTWNTYPDITYKTHIDNITINNNYATVATSEIATALAGASTDINSNIDAYGELYTTSKCVYHLVKTGKTWIITSENILSEQSSLKFGQAKYINIKLNAPQQIGANEEYTSTLTVNIPEQMNAIASINREKITYPQVKSDDAFRTLSDNKDLERVFHANGDNVNEYNIAAIAIGLANSDSISMTGAAFIMSRINVVPKNKYVEDVKKVEQQQKNDAAKLQEELNNAKAE